MSSEWKKSLLEASRSCRLKPVCCRYGATAALLLPASDLWAGLLFNFLRQRLNIPAGINKAGGCLIFLPDTLCLIPSAAHTPNSLFTNTGPGREAFIKLYYLYIIWYTIYYKHFITSKLSAKLLSHILFDCCLYFSILLQFLVFTFQHITVLASNLLPSNPQL